MKPNPNPNPTPTPKQVGEGHTTEDPLPLYQKLLSDEQVSPQYLPGISPASPLFSTLTIPLSDEQDSVRVNALKSSAAICRLGLVGLANPNPNPNPHPHPHPYPHPYPTPHPLPHPHPTPNSDPKCMYLSTMGDDACRP